MSRDERSNLRLARDRQTTPPGALGAKRPPALPWRLCAFALRLIQASARVDRSIELRYPFAMTFGVLFEKVTDKKLPTGYYYAHVPSLGLTTHGKGVEGARQAAADLLQLWIAEKRANGEKVNASGETLFSTLEVPDDALQGA
jgi:predicted RNase H-like HicB family nuclease